MQSAISSLRSLLTSPGDNLAALGTLIAIFVIATIILVLLIIAFVLPGSQDDEDEEAEEESAPAAATTPDHALLAEEEPEAEAVGVSRRPGRVSGVLGCLTALVIFAVGSAGAFAFWYVNTSTNEYCGTSCHEMLEPANTHGASAHASVTCVQCHEGPRWSNPGNVIVRRGRYLYAGATGTPVTRSPFAEAPCIECHREVLTGEVTARSGEPFLHSDVLSPGQRCGECHPRQGHVPAR